MLQNIFPLEKLRTQSPTKTSVTKQYLFGFSRIHLQTQSIGPHCMTKYVILGVKW